MTRKTILTHDAKLNIYKICHKNERVAMSLIRYVEYGEPTGDFLRAFLSNNLFMTFTHHDGLTDLNDLFRWLYNDAPLGCWGSPEQYDSWINDEN